MTIGQTGGSNQAQRTKQKTRQEPFLAAASLLPGNGFCKTCADHMRDQRQQHKLQDHHEAFQSQLRHSQSRQVCQSFVNSAITPQMAEQTPRPVPRPLGRSRPGQAFGCVHSATSSTQCFCDHSTKNVDEALRQVGSRTD